jgi:hypothetical protein
MWKIADQDLPVGFCLIETIAVLLLQLHNPVKRQHADAS